MEVLVWVHVDDNATQLVTPYILLRGGSSLSFMYVCDQPPQIQSSRGTQLIKRFAPFTDLQTHLDEAHRDGELPIILTDTFEEARRVLTFVAGTHDRIALLSDGEVPCATTDFFIQEGPSQGDGVKFLLHMEQEIGSPLTHLALLSGNFLLVDEANQSPRLVGLHKPFSGMAELIQRFIANQPWK